MSSIFWFIIAGIVVGGVAIIIAIAAVNGVRLPTEQFTLPTWRNVGTIALVVLALLVLYFGILTPKWETPHPADVGIWSSNHWFWLLILWGIDAALIALNACGVVAKKTLQWILAGVMVAVLIVFPLWGLAASPAAPAHSTTAAQQPPQKRMLSMSANGDSTRITVPVGYGPVFTGHGFVVSCVYEDGTEDVGEPAVHPCRSGPMAYQIVHDTSGFPNSVMYEFVRAQ